MKIAVIAANGRAGQAFVAQALAAGHTIRAGIRGNSSLDKHPKLQEVRCDATNEQDLARLITGCAAVVSLIGHVKGSPENVQTVAMEKLILAMKQQKIKRVVSLTGTGVRFDHDRITLIDRFLNIGVRLVDPKRVKDGRQAAELLRKSDLDWTIIRVLKLQNVPPKAFRLSVDGPTKVFVGRVEVAQAILELLDKKSFIKQAPMISKP